MRIQTSDSRICNLRFAIRNLQSPGQEPGSSGHGNDQPLQNANCKLQNAKCKMQIAKCKLQIANWKSGARPAFTLIELIIVIAIIAILAALTTGVAMRFYGIQQQRNSEVTVTKLYETLKD